MIYMGVKNTRYCGVMPKFCHVSLQKRVWLLLRTSGNHLTNIRFMIEPINLRDFIRYDNAKLPLTADKMENTIAYIICFYSNEISYIPMFSIHALHLHLQIKHVVLVYCIRISI